MSQSSIAPLQTPPPMKKKVLAAVLAVVVGHVGVLWGVSHMKPFELPQIKKEPLKIKFLKLKEDVPPPPPPPSEPIKPKVQPKPIEKKVEPKPVVKPKIIEQKKPVENDDRARKLEEQKRLEEQQKQDKARQDEQKRQDDQKRAEQQKREQDERDRQKREQDERDRQRRDQEQRNTPRNVNEGQVSWSRSPRIAKEQLLKLMSPEDGTKVVNLEITADAGGNITNVRILQSSGNPSLDSYVVKQTQSAKFKAYRENGAGVPFKIRQDFALSVSKK